MARFQPAGFEEEDDFDGFVFNSYGEDDSTENFMIPEKNSFSANVTQEYVGNGFHENKIKTKDIDLINLEEDFRQSVMRNNRTAAEDCLFKGVKVDSLLKSGWTGLMYAASGGKTEMVQLLLRYGANPDFAKDQYTPLMAACGSNKGNEDDLVNVVKLLVQAGACVNNCDTYNMTPLIYASRDGRCKLMKVLLEKNADVNSYDNKGWTSLTWAASRGRTEAVTLLLEHNADVNKLANDGQNAAGVALSCGKNNIAHILQAASGNTPGGDAQKIQNAVETLKSTPDESEVSSTTEPERYERFGELELLLSGLQLTDLIQLFNDRGITFSHFLRLRDGDLIEMGITKLSVRKKILDAIQATHKREWEDKSLVSPVQYNKHINCTTASAMVKNITKHIEYIGSTIGFTKDQILANPDLLKTAQEPNAVKNLSRYTEESIQNVRELYRELTQLNTHINKVMDLPEYQTPDLIIKSKKKNKNSSLLIALTIGSISATIVCLKPQILTFVLEKCKSLKPS